MTNSIKISETDWLRLLNTALEEDSWKNDVTTKTCLSYLDANSITTKKLHHFRVSNRKPILFSGKGFVESACKRLEWEFSNLKNDGDFLNTGETLFEGWAPAHSLFPAERSVLNILQHLCGISTHTYHLKNEVLKIWQKWSDADKSKCPKPDIYHTRKTLPGMRTFQIFASEVGGAKIHRLNLEDRAMFKDNHKDMISSEGSSYSDFYTWSADSDLKEVISNAIFEADSKSEALELYQAGARHILLDNFSPLELPEMVSILPDAELEVSGGLSKENISDYVVPGITRISIGSITHTVEAADIGLDYIK